MASFQSKTGCKTCKVEYTANNLQWYCIVFLIVVFNLVHSASASAVQAKYVMNSKKVGQSTPVNSSSTFVKSSEDKRISRRDNITQNFVGGFTLSSRGNNDENIITSLERPPVVSKEQKQSQRRTKVGKKVIARRNGVSPSNNGKRLQNIVKSRRKQKVNVGKLRTILNSLSLPDRLKSVVAKISNAFFGTKGTNGASTGRYSEGFMEGAMVPMSFLLMAAFIMDILQRLFPLPYATFVHQAAHHGGISRVGTTTPRPSDLSKFQVQTPLGTLGVSTNEKNSLPFNLFGRSNQGYPEIIPDDIPPHTSQGQGYSYGYGNGYGNGHANTQVQTQPTVEDTYGLTAEQAAQLLYLNNNNNYNVNSAGNTDNNGHNQNSNNADSNFYNNPSYIASTNNEGQSDSHGGYDQLSYQTQSQSQSPNQEHPQQEQEQNVESQQQQQQQQQEQQQQQQSSSSTSTENNTDDSNTVSPTTEADQEAENSIARFDYVDYYSRFDENSESRRRKRLVT